MGSEGTGSLPEAGNVVPNAAIAKADVNKNAFKFLCFITRNPPLLLGQFYICKSVN